MADGGAFISALSANTSNAGTYGFITYLGGIIAAWNGSGTLNQSANTLTSNGIIFK